MTYRNSPEDPHVAKNREVLERQAEAPTQLVPFDLADWEAFGGCLSPNPWIAYLGDLGVLIVDDATLGVQIGDGEERDEYVIRCDSCEAARSAARTLCKVFDEMGVNPVLSLAAAFGQQL